MLCMLLNLGTPPWWSAPPARHCYILTLGAGQCGNSGGPATSNIYVVTAIPKIWVNQASLNSRYTVKHAEITTIKKGSRKGCQLHEPLGVLGTSVGTCWNQFIISQPFPTINHSPSVGKLWTSPTQRGPASLGSWRLELGCQWLALAQLVLEAGQLSLVKTIIAHD